MDSLFFSQAMNSGVLPFLSAELILAFLVDVNKANNSGSTPLMISCSKGNTKVLRLLLEKGAIFNQCDAESLTPRISIRIFFINRCPFLQ
jgi:ankyrin repeat protein